MAPPVSKYGVLIIVINWIGDRGSTVVKPMCYKTEGRWFEHGWCHLNFSLT